jgi:hypothetical protein
MKTVRALILIGLTVFGVAPAVAQVTTGNVAGSVRDAQGGLVPGATVTLTSATRGTSLEAQTNANGDFVFPNVTGDTYIIKVTLEGFKTLERKNIAVSPGDRVAVGALTLEVGTLSETVTVAGESPVIQASSGERSFTVTTEAVQNLPINTRNWSALTALTPGVVGSTRLGNAGTQNNTVMMDGVAIMDTGNNGQMLQTNIDAIAEVKILTSGYQAEYGRSSGMQITAVTKSGSNRFRGSTYDIERNSDWNANSWANQRNGDPKAVSKQRDWGYTIGGPVGKPGGSNKLFFFYGHEYRPRTSGGDIRRFRVPTALERAGDFSQTTDNTGALFNRIYDAATGLPKTACSATDQRACFQDGGVLGRIPANRQYAVGLNILKLWPLPDAQGLNYNYENTAPTDNRITQQPTGRIDYQWSSKLRLTAKYTGQLATVKVSEGSIPGFNDTLQKYPFIYQPSATVNYVLTPTLFIEATYGYIQNQLGSPIVSPASNRCNVGLCDIPLLFPDAGIVDPRYYNPTVLEAIKSPMFVDGKILLPPTFSWGNRIANSPPSLIYPAFLNLNRTHNVNVSATKVAGRHALKSGFYWFSAYKAENLGITGAIPFNGMLRFDNDTNNPIDSGFGYANAALGIFSEYSQQSKFIEGGYRYKNVEAFVQDNWKVTGRLTLDYGLRFTHQQPQHDSLLQASNFFPEKWTRANAPQLYLPGCTIVASPCPSANRVAVNAATGASLGANTALAIGTLVPDTGSRTNGIIQAGQGIAKENYIWPALGVAPRIGAAYDLTGTQRLVVRGNFGLFYDRPEGNTTSNQIGNPPNSTATTVRYAQLQTLGTGGLTTQAPAQLAIFKYDSPLPAMLQWGAGIQMMLPWASALDVSYVASHGYNLVNPFNQTVDINAPDIGAAFLAQNQDPTLSSTTPGGAALSTDLLRPFRGLGPINMQWSRFWNDFHSIQTAYNRRFLHGLQFGFNHTLTLRQAGTNNLNSTSGLRLVHKTDGSFTESPDWKQGEKLFENNGLRRHVIKGYAIWDLPDLHATSGFMRALAVLANDWQISPILTAGSGATYDISYQYQNGGSSVNLTGSPNYAARIRIVGDTGSGCSGNQYAQFNVAAFAGPVSESTGLESGRNYMIGCPDKNLDLAIVRAIRLGGSKRIELRADIFNALNTVLFAGRQTQLQLNSPTDPTVRNPQFLAGGSLNPDRVLPRNAGFGAVSSAQAMRSAQLQFRFQF